MFCHGERGVPDPSHVRLGFHKQSPFLISKSMRASVLKTHFLCTLFKSGLLLTSVPAGSDRSPAALRIIHPGGLIEQYYMAIPAARIIEKYPSFILTRPDVFRRPWDAVVPPGDILIPGQKYFVVPRQTVKKLRRRIKKPTAINSGILFASSEGNNSLSSCEFSEETDVKRSSGIMINQPRNRGVRFFGIDKKDDSGSDSSEQSSVPVEVAGKSSNRRRGDGRKGRSRNIVHWQPSLTSIEENNDADE